MASSRAGRLFLCWAAFLALTSWVGIALAEAERFSARTALAAGAVGALAAGLAAGRCRAHRSSGESGAGAGAPAEPLAGRGATPAGRLAGRGETPAAPPAGGQVALVALLALCSTATLGPAVDTTLLSQDASIHLAAGRWLARTGSLAVDDPTLVGVPESVRLALFEPAARGIVWFSQSRLPGGLVAVDRLQTRTYPSFAHLLSVWIAIADSVAGDRGIALLGPLLAFSAWWAIGLVALARGGSGAAVAAIALLATWLPEHWFARFLMPEILAQALVWAGIAIASSALGAAEGAIAGACIGVACFARLEQLTSFLPALLLARALLPTARRVLPRGALVPLLAAAVHAAWHLKLVPTDYGKRIAVLALRPVPRVWPLLGGTPRRALATLALALAATAVVGWAMRRWRKGLFTRIACGVLGVAAFAATLSVELPHELPALHWLWWYVPKAAWLAAAAGLWPPFAPSGLGFAVAIEALDQVVSPRVTFEQVWASRRLVTAVLPLLALAAGFAVARRDRPRGPRRAALGAALVAVAVAQGALGLHLVLGQRLQAGGATFAREVGAAIPRGSVVVLAPELDWLHIAPSLWLESDLVPIVARRRESFAAALGDYLRRSPEREVFVLAGVVTTGEGPVDPAAFRPALPAGLVLEPVRTFTWSADLLERREDGPPSALVKHRAEIALLRARRSATAVDQ